MSLPRISWCLLADPKAGSPARHLILAYRWFCQLSLQGQVPDHSTFSKNRHGRFRESELFRFVFESVVERCIDEGWWAANYAAALSEYTRAEPLPWSDFIIARGRALADYGRGNHDDKLMQTLQRLRDEAEHVGFKAVFPAREEALSAY